MLSKIVSEILGAGAELRNDKLNTHHNKKLREKYLLVLVVILLKNALQFSRHAVKNLYK
jgi:hypothetical protein